jgi:hypothetical protein
VTAKQQLANEPTSTGSELRDETHEAAMRIAAERRARDERLRKAEEESLAHQDGEVSTSIGDA